MLGFCSQLTRKVQTALQDLHEYLLEMKQFLLAVCAF